MKIQRLDAHDRLLHFNQQNFSIGECCQDLINKRPYGEHPFYIFAHTRTDDDGVTKRLIWQPRLTKPKAQTNSMLFKAYPGTDLIKVLWMIPSRELFAQYKKGNLTESKLVSDSIRDFETNREKLEAKEMDDLEDHEIDAIYQEISKEARYEANKKEAMSKKIEEFTPI